MNTIMIVIVPIIIGNGYIVQTCTNNCEYNRNSTDMYWLLVLQYPTIVTQHHNNHNNNHGENTASSSDSSGLSWLIVIPNKPLSVTPQNFTHQRYDLFMLHMGVIGDRPTPKSPTHWIFRAFICEPLFSFLSPSPSATWPWKIWKSATKNCGCCRAWWEAYPLVMTNIAIENGQL